MKMPTAMSAIALTLALNGTVQAGERENADGTAVTNDYVVVRSTDFQGRPPFRRSQENVPVVDVAKFEPTNAATTVEISTDFRGRPPFARNREVLRSVDIARFETVDGERRRASFSGKPPFRRALP